MVKSETGVSIASGLEVVVSRPAGRYVYGVAASGAALKLGDIGLDGSPVYTLLFRDICAVVHDCPTQPYASAECDMVRRWVESHEGVLEKARDVFGTVVPMRFDVIISLRDGSPADEVIRDWLKQDYDRLKAVLQRISGVSEYAVQISYEPVIIGRQIAGGIKNKKPAATPGAAYLQQQRLEKLAKSQLEALADKMSKHFLKRVESCCREVVVEKAKGPAAGRVMLLNLSCLVSPEAVGSLGEELEKISRIPGFSVHFSGPWLPYSFAGEPPLPGGG